MSVLSLNHNRTMCHERIPHEDRDVDYKKYLAIKNNSNMDEMLDSTGFLGWSKTDLLSLHMLYYGLFLVFSLSSFASFK